MKKIKDIRDIVELCSIQYRRAERLEKAGYPIYVALYPKGEKVIRQPKFPDVDELMAWLSEKVDGIGFVRHNKIWYIQRFIAMPDGKRDVFYSVYDEDLNEALVQAVEQVLGKDMTEELEKRRISLGLKGKAK